MCNFGSNYRFVPTTQLRRCLVRYLVQYLVLNLDMRQGLLTILMPPTGGIAEGINALADEVRVLGR